MHAADPIEELQHDHGLLNRRVLDIGACVQKLERSEDVDTARRHLSRALPELREDLFLHFAREEEGLFPFVASALPDLADAVIAVVQAHDSLCGMLARMIHTISGPQAGWDSVILLFSRFETAYVEHAEMERTMLEMVAPRLDPDQRAELAALLRGL